MSFLCLVSVFKNESHILEEWIQHYIKQGVDHFFLTDNGSTDEYMKILKKYISTGIVSLNVNPEKYKQIEHLNFFLGETKKYDWAIVCDLDEFIYARKGFTSIKEYLNTLTKDVVHVCIPWKLFGSNGHIQQPHLVIPHFLKRLHHKNLIAINSKCITRCNYIHRIYQHSNHNIENNGILITSDGKLHENGRKEFAHISENILKDSCLHLNHYAIQSWEWFKNVKMTRGDVLSPESDHVRDENYFKGYDHNGVLDEELKNLNSI